MLHPSRRRWRAAARLVMLSLGLLAPASAAPVAGDLGDELHYYRATELPADLPPPPAGKTTALVLDLRYVSADEPAATALEAWLKFRATAHTPIFVLVNHATAPVIDAVLAAQKSNPGLLSIGESAPGFTPDVPVAVKPDDERRAYDSAQHGTPLAALVTPPVDKPRSDEAALLRERAPFADADPGADELDLSDEPPPANAVPAPSPPVDLALQRAVQIHRGLRALKRL